LLHLNNNTNNTSIANNTSNTNNRRNNNNFRRQNSNRSSIGNTFNNSLGRINIGDRSFVIDNYEEYYIPRTFRSLTNNREPGSIYSRIFENFFDPVPVYPTQTQVEIATRRVRYCDIVTPLNTSCPISLEPFNDNDSVTVIRHCGHIFNTTEINNWFRSNCVCPVCRYDIRNYNTRTINSNPNVNHVENHVENQEDSSTQERTPANTEVHYFNELMHDFSGNLLSDGSDASAILNILSNFMQRRSNF